MPGSTDARLGSYDPAPGVSVVRVLPRCADDERNAALGMCVASDMSFLPRYVPGPGVSSPMMSSFISRADAAPKPPAPARFERPNDACASAARSRVAFGSYAPGSPVASSTCRRCEPDLKAEACPSTDAPFFESYAPGPGMSACSFWYGSSRAGWRVPKPGFDRLILSTDFATDAASEPST